MSETLKWISTNIGYIMTIVGGLSALGAFIWKVIFKPLRDSLNSIQTELKDQSKMLKNLDADTADLLCSQLVREHDDMMSQGFCPTADKERIGGIYTRYRNRGRNHIADTYMTDITHLPSTKP